MTREKITFIYRNNRTDKDKPENLVCSLCGRNINEVANCAGNNEVKVCVSCVHEIKDAFPDIKTETITAKEDKHGV